jgi:hypothetical protein
MTHENKRRKNNVTESRENQGRRQSRMSHYEPSEFAGWPLRVAFSSPRHCSLLLTHHFPLYFPFRIAFTFSTDPEFTGSVAIAASFLKDLFMQPEPTAVSPNTPPIDLSPINPSSTQHGHDLDDAQATGFLHEEPSDSADVSGMPTQDKIHASLNGDSSAPPSNRVNQHENARSPPRKSNEVGFGVDFDEKPQVLIEVLPNGKYIEPHRAVLPLIAIISRGSHSYPVASISRVPIRHYIGIASIPFTSHDTPCMENCLLPLLPRAPNRGGWHTHYQ